MAGPVRQPIDIPALERYIEEHVSEIKTPLQVSQFGFGQSNPTYLFIDARDARCVLRKKPPGKLLSKTAHKVEREYRIIHALRDTDVPVPRTYCLCSDDGIIGTPFYIMSFLDGRIFEDPAFPGVSSLERTEMWHEAIRVLAKLHRVSPSSVGLEKYGKSSGFYDRQISTLEAISKSQASTVDIESQKAVGKIPHVDAILSFFRNKPTQPRDRTSLVHGDYKIDNLVYHKTESRVIGILDWEMSTLGHPLSDLANLLQPYLLSSTPIAREIGLDHPAFAASTSTSPTSTTTRPPTNPPTEPGLPTASQCLTWYEQEAGWDPRSAIPWGEAFGMFRNSVIMQGIKARYALRQASSARAKEVGEHSDPLGEFTWELVRKLQAGDDRVDGDGDQACSIEQRKSQQQRDRNSKL